jgi:hypothetical protein
MGKVNQKVDPLPSVLWLDERSFRFNGEVLIFFQPVYLHFQLADLLVKTGDERFLAFFSFAGLGREEFGQAIKGLFFPLCNLRGMDPILSSNFIGCFWPFKSLQGNFRLQVGTVSFSLH